MKHKIFLVLASLLVTISLAACGSVAPLSSGTAAQIRTLSASGEGIVYLTPDVAYIYVGVRSEDEDVSTALNDNNIQANAVAQTITDMGVEAKDIQTTSFNVYPMQDYSPDGTISRKYYVVENTVYITVRDLAKLGSMIDAVVKSGANTINSVTFDVQDKDTAVAQARDMAIADAVEEAKSIAAASGVKLGELQSVSVYAYNTPTSVYDAKGGGGYATQSSVPVSAGQLVITASANMTYEIK